MSVSHLKHKFQSIFLGEQWSSMYTIESLQDAYIMRKCEMQRAQYNRDICALVFYRNYNVPVFSIKNFTISSFDSYLTDFYRRVGVLTTTA